MSLFVVAAAIFEGSVSFVVCGSGPQPAPVRKGFYLVDKAAFVRTKSLVGVAPVKCAAAMRARHALNVVQEAFICFCIVFPHDSSPTSVIHDKY